MARCEARETYAGIRLFGSRCLDSAAGRSVYSGRTRRGVGPIRRTPSQSPTRSSDRRLGTGRRASRQAEPLQRVTAIDLPGSPDQPPPAQQRHRGASRAPVGVAGRHDRIPGRPLPRAVWSGAPTASCVGRGLSRRRRAPGRSAPNGLTTLELWPPVAGPCSVVALADRPSDCLSFSRGFRPSSPTVTA